MKNKKGKHKQEEKEGKIGESAITNQIEVILGVT
jgi:hypothetical protein